MEPLQKDTEGYFFDVCTELWEDVNKQPTVRYYAGCYILTMAAKYPDMKNKLELIMILSKKLSLYLAATTPPVIPNVIAINKAISARM